MLLLMVFAAIAGAATAVSPCVLPVLPALLSAGAVGGRRRPLGVVTGLAVTFTITIAGLATVIDGVGVADGVARKIAIAVLLAAGVALLVPALGDRIEAPLSRLARFGPRSRGTGFWSGLVVGAALGFLYAPCAGPILAAVVSVGVSRGSSGEIVALAASYSIGSAAVLLVLTLGGRRLAERLRSAARGPALQRAVGVVLLATAVLMAADLDVRFQTALARHVPDFLVNPTKSLETSSAVEKRLADVRGHPRFDSSTAHAATATRRSDAGMRSSLPVLGAAPDFTDNQRWLNTPGGRPLTLRALRGKVVLVDFWTYTCINCIRTLPYVEAWYQRYRDRGLVVVGVHTPEFGFEKDAGNVEAAIRQNGLRYPVAQDNDYGTWNAWSNQFWPAKYLIDARGQVRYTHFGEGDYGKTEGAIRSLLQEASSTPLGRRARAGAEVPSARLQTPETYLGSARSDRVLPSAVRSGTHTYRPLSGRLRLNHLTFGGTWSIGEEAATARAGSTLKLAFAARRVFLVLGSEGGAARPLRILLDGRPVSRRRAGGDAHGSIVTVRGQRLYRLIDLPKVERHELELHPAPGISGYAFTFG
jgi:cytochrome c biogenesis protein CcdA/thiol-disulfide isomerase/thioredoxin